MSFLKENLRVLNRNDKIISSAIDWQSQVKEERVLETFEVNSIQYHSVRDPTREAERQFKGLDAKKSHAIFLGCGLGYLLERAIEKYDSILVIEPDLEVLGLMLNRFKLDETKISPEIFFFSQNDVTLEEALYFFQGKNIDDIELIPFRPAFQAKPELYLPLHDLLKSLLEKRSINQATIIKFQDLWNRNIIFNVKEIIGGYRFNDLIASLNLDLAVIAGAGPSLADSFADLRKYREHFTLIVPDTAFIPLSNHGVMPDFVVSADPQWYNHFYVQSERAKETIWLLDPVVNYMIPHYLSELEAQVFFWNNPFYIDKIIQRYTGARGEVSHGGSVSTNSFDFAVQCGAKQIALIGQDLSFWGKVAHVKGAVLESQIFERHNRFFTIERHNLKQMNALPKIEVEPINAKDKGLFTNAKLQVFIQWFEEQAKRHQNLELYNCTEHGVKLTGYEHLKLSELIRNQKRVAITGKFKSSKPGNLNSDLKKLQTDIITLKAIFKENIGLAKQVAVKANQSTTGKLNSNDQRVKSLKEANEVVGLSAQKAILEITEAGKNDAPKLYKALYKAAKTTEYLFSKIN